MASTIAVDYLNVVGYKDGSLGRSDGTNTEDYLNVVGYKEELGIDIMGGGDKDYLNVVGYKGLDYEALVVATLNGLSERSGI